MSTKCSHQECDRDDANVLVQEMSTENAVVRIYCSRAHAVEDMLRREVADLAGNSKRNIKTLLKTASAIIGKLTRAVEKEWQKAKG